jgi:hypothetical protein
MSGGAFVQSKKKKEKNPKEKSHYVCNKGTINCNKNP